VLGTIAQRLSRNLLTPPPVTLLAGRALLPLALIWVVAGGGGRFRVSTNPSVEVKDEEGRSGGGDEVEVDR
jgi:hypothetical protein